MPKQTTKLNTLKAPDFLSEKAKAKFIAMTKAAKFDSSHEDNLAAYCAAYDRWRTAEEWLANPAHGSVVTIRDDKGNIRTHGPSPQIAVAAQASKEMQRLSKLLPQPSSKSANGYTYL